MKARAEGKRGGVWNMECGGRSDNEWGAKARVRVWERMRSEE